MLWGLSFLIHAINKGMLYYQRQSRLFSVAEDLFCCLVGFLKFLQMWWSELFNLWKLRWAVSGNVNICSNVLWCQRRRCFWKNYETMREVGKESKGIISNTANQIVSPTRNNQIKLNTASSFLILMLAIYNHSAVSSVKCLKLFSQL